MSLQATPVTSATPRAKFRSRLAFWERGTGLFAQTLNITSTPGPPGPARAPLAPVALNTESSPAQEGFKSPTTKGFSPSVSFELDDAPQPTPARERGSSFSVTPGVAAQGHEKVRVPAGTLRSSEPSDASGGPPDAQPLRTPWDRPGDVQRVREHSAASQDAALSEAVTTAEAVAQDGDAPTDANVARTVSPIARTPSASSDGAGHAWPPQRTPPPIEVDGDGSDPLPSVGKRTPDSVPAAESFVDPIASSDAATGSPAPTPAGQSEEHEREIIAITERHAKELAAKETSACDEIAHLHASLAEAKSAQLEAADLLQAYQSELTEQLETSKAALVAATSKEQALRAESEAAAAAARADADVAHAKAGAARAEADAALAEAAAARADAAQARAAEAERARAAGADEARAADADRERAASISAAHEAAAEANARVEAANTEAEAAQRAAAEARDEAARARASVSEAETRIRATEAEAEAARQQTAGARADAEAAREAAEKAEAAWREERARLEAALEEEARTARDNSSSDELESKLAEKSVQLEAVTAQMVVEKKLKEEMVEQHAAQQAAVREEVASTKRAASQREAEWAEQKKSLEEQLKLREMESAAIARDAKQEMIKEAEKQFAVAKQQFSKLKAEKDALAATVAKQAQAMKDAEAKWAQDQREAEAAISADRSRREEAEQQLSKVKAQVGEERERADKAEATAKEANDKLVESTKINVELMAMLDQ